MVQVSDAKFIVIDNEVAMSEETACEILGVSSDKLRELSRQAKSSKGIHVRGGQMYFSTVEAIFAVRDANGKKSADLSTVELTRMFELAEDRLLPREIVKAKRKRTYIKMGVFGLIVVGFFVYAVNSEPTPKPAPAPPPKVETPVEKPVEAPVSAPVKVVNLGMTFEQFKVSYNAKIAEIAPETGWDISNVPLTIGKYQDVFMWQVGERVSMLGTVGKDGLLKDVMVMSLPREEPDGDIALLSYGLVISTLNPELDYSQRLALITELKLKDGDSIRDLTQSDGVAIRGNVRYRTSFLKEKGAFHFFASAKDL